MELTPQLQLAERYVNDTNVSLFLTGKAGTGKTTFLHHIDATTPKRHAVLAPTGVAAINAGGVTIHSFFQLPLCPYLPDVPELVTEYQMPDKHRGLRKNRIEIIRTLELLVIDEISMVRADLLDAVDYTLRRYRRNNRPFGGVQLLMIGDVQQLPPIVTDAEKPYMDRVYASPFFFNSKALQKIQYTTIELTTIFRQRDESFVRLLNSVRDNRVDDASLSTLNSRYNPSFEPATTDYIRLTTHNRQADSINQRKLAELPSKSALLKATVEGSFPETSYPTELQLELKEGAQVMFIKNDISGEHRFYNGKIVTVKGVSRRTDEAGNTVERVLTVDSDGDEIEVGRYTWENVKYELDNNDNQIKQKVDGTFTQFPLRLAWAITIHKSQGLTFDHVIIDAGSAFSYGQVYVALSRCRTFEGIVLCTPITRSCLFSSEEVNRFNDTIPQLDTVQANLGIRQMDYFYDELNELFDMSAVTTSAERLNNVYQNRLRNLFPERAAKLSALVGGTLADLATVADRFRNQLAQIKARQYEIIEQGRVALEMHAVTDYRGERVGKAIEYFRLRLDSFGAELLPLCSAEIDNKENAREFKEAAERAADAIELKAYCMQRMWKDGFSVEGYQQAKVDYVLNEKDKEEVARPARTTRGREATGLDTRHPQLMRALVNWRRAEAAKINKPAFVVLRQVALIAIANELPRTKRELLEIPHFGKKTFEAYGIEILGIISEYVNNVFDKPSAESQSRSVCTMPRRENEDCEETNVFDKQELRS